MWKYRILKFEKLYIQEFVINSQEKYSAKFNTFFCGFVDEHVVHAAVLQIVCTFLLSGLEKHHVT